MVIIPKPPACISNKITVFPKRDQYVAVSLTIRPVTHTAEVAVNKASMKAVGFPEAVAWGKESKIVPMLTINKKPNTMI